MVAQITGYLEITTPMNQIERMVLQESAKVANAKFPSVVNNVKNDLMMYIANIFPSSPEYQSIISGQLQHQFGIPAGEASTKVQNIVAKMVNSTQVIFHQFRVRGNTIGGGLEILAIASDFADILSLDDAEQITEKGVRLPWLEWLLIEGDKVIIQDYYFKPGNYNNSRSGNGIMIVGQSKFWRVPPQFAGTIQNNWVTRTIDTYINDIEQIVETSIRKHL